LVFQKILHRAVQKVDGAVGAMFVDFQGESVDSSSASLTRYDLGVFGAYQGIYLDRLRDLCRGNAYGRPIRFKIGCREAIFLNYVLTDEYYLVLILTPAANEGLAWRILEECRNEILEEMA